MLPPSNESKSTESKENSADSSLSLPAPFERFKLLKRIARGGMGEVYLATAGGIEGAERPVVIKIIRRDHDTDSSFLARFLDEARIQSQLHHPGVAQVLEASTDESGKPYVVVEYVEGRNLSDVRGRAAQLGVRIEWPEAVALAISMGDALAHVHERTDAEGRPLDIVHRDLSPQNVMVGYGGDAKLIDFGTARGENRRCHTISGVVFAKPGYVAPEVANNTPGGVPADLYAFGIILWELLVGRRFLVGEPALHLAAVGAGKKTPTAIAQALGASPELDQVIQRLTAVRIEDRYACARKAVSDLVRVLQRAPSLADGDRSVRGRIAQLMRTLYPAEPARSRAEFQSLLGASRTLKPVPPALPPPSPPPPASDEKLLEGTRYRIERELGRGATGVVYEALHLDLGRRVALKVLHDGCTGESRTRFVAEARAVARVSHDGLVELYEFGFSSDGRPFYAMELVAGEPLDRRLLRKGAFPWREAVAIARETCHAVEAAHAAGLVHRDIKPANVILRDSGAVKVLDFGVAKRENELEVSHESDAGALVVVGTPEYMAPEQARGAADARSDVYGIAAMLYELCTGLLPYQATTAVQLIEQKSSAPPALASSQAPDAGLPRALDRLLTRALAPHPESRFSSVAELREGLALLIDERVRSRVRRRRIGIGLVAGLTLAAAAAVGSRAHHLVPPGYLPSAALGRELLDRALGPWGHSPAQSAPQVAAVPAPQAAAAPAPQAAAAVLPAAPAPALPAGPEQAGATAAAAGTLSGELAQAEASEPGAPSAEVATSDPADEANTAPAVAGPEAKPADPAVEKVLAEIAGLREKGRALKALHVVRGALKSFPKEPALLQELARAAQESKAWGEARRAAAQWVAVEPSTEARLTLARLERATGNTEKGLAIARAVAQDDAASEEARRLVQAWSHDQRVALNR
jgi:serine/threonine-protein kinase